MRALFGPLVIIGLIAGAWLLLTNRAPAGISEARYERYQRLSAPKLLYSCTRKPTDAAVTKKARECAQSGRSGCEQEAYEAREGDTKTNVDFVGGPESASSYDELVQRAERSCEGSLDGMTTGSFKVLESAKE